MITCSNKMPLRTNNSIKTDSEGDEIKSHSSLRVTEDLRMISKLFIGLKEDKILKIWAAEVTTVKVVYHN